MGFKEIFHKIKNFFSSNEQITTQRNLQNLVITFYDYLVDEVIIEDRESAFYNSVGIKRASWSKYKKNLAAPSKDTVYSIMIIKNIVGVNASKLLEAAGLNFSMGNSQEKMLAEINDEFTQDLENKIRNKEKELGRPLASNERIKLEKKIYDEFKYDIEEIICDLEKSEKTTQTPLKKCLKVLKRIFNKNKLD